MAQINEFQKCCSKCKSKLAATSANFGPDKRAKDGFQSQCRSCKKLSDMYSYEKHRKQRLEQQKQRYKQEAVRNKRKTYLSQYYKTKKWQSYYDEYYNTAWGRLIRTYSNMRNRCNNPKHKDYHNYGGRGIKCLFKSGPQFANYVIQILKVNPIGLEIDRINVNGNYERGNIRFVTHQQNCLNKRK